MNGERSSKTRDKRKSYRLNKQREKEIERRKGILQEGNKTWNKKTKVERWKKNTGQNKNSNKIIIKKTMFG